MKVTSKTGKTYDYPDKELIHTWLPKDLTDITRVVASKMDIPHSLLIKLMLRDWIQTEFGVDVDMAKVQDARKKLFADENS